MQIEIMKKDMSPENQPVLSSEIMDYISKRARDSQEKTATYRVMICTLIGNILNECYTLEDNYRLPAFQNLMNQIWIWNGCICARGFVLKNMSD